MHFVSGPRKHQNGQQENFMTQNMFIIWSNVIIFDSFKLSCYTCGPQIFFMVRHMKNMIWKHWVVEVGAT